MTPSASIPRRATVKTLRIFARDPRGGNRTFEYQEGSIVDGSQFSEWSTGRWGDLKPPGRH